MKDLTINDLLMYIGIFVVSLFVIYMLKSVFNTQKTLIEGLTNYGVSSNGSLSSNFTQILTSGNIDKLESNTKILEDGLYINKYKTEYENMIIYMEDYLNNLIIANLLETSNTLTSGKKEDIEQLLDNKIPQINELYKFKENLNISMYYLDKK
jgi:hypothetical protein